MAVASACGGGADESAAPSTSPAEDIAAPADSAVETPSDGAAPAEQPVESQPASSAPAEPAAVPVPEILEFTTVDLAGAEVDGASFAGRPVAFWFWAPT